MASTVSDEIEHAHKKVQSEAAQHDLKENLSSLKSDVANLTSSVKRLADAEFGNAASHVQEKAQQHLGDIEASIRKNPTQAALIAAGVGLLVGLIVSR